MIFVLQVNRRLDIPVALHQHSNKKFRVTYGKHVVSQLTYEQACLELGSCIMHSASCASRLEGEEQ